jgi:hypothetical protein
MNHPEFYSADERNEPCKTMEAGESCSRAGASPIGANLRERDRKKGGEKADDKPFRGTVKKNREETYQEKRHVR